MLVATPPKVRREYIMSTEDYSAMTSSFNGRPLMGDYGSGYPAAIQQLREGEALFCIQGYDSGPVALPIPNAAAFEENYLTYTGDGSSSYQLVAGQAPVPATTISREADGSPITVENASP